jgi:hypothetical protein
MNEKYEEKQADTAADLKVTERHDSSRSEEANYTLKQTSPADESRATNGSGIAEEGAAPVFVRAEVEEWQSRWRTIQMGFVDQPQAAVEQADTLIGEVIEHLAELLAAERGELKQEWVQKDNHSTEELRLALQHYRAIFNHLISV